MITARLVFVALLLSALGASGCAAQRRYHGRDLSYVSNFDPLGQEYGEWRRENMDTVCRVTMRVKACADSCVRVTYRQCFDIDEWAALPLDVRRHMR